jgi:hypothetical protein
MMAHHLFDFEKMCDEVCTSALDDIGPDSNEEVPVVLMEAQHDGKVTISPITEELLSTYIEKDFKVNHIAHHV